LIKKLKALREGNGEKGKKCCIKTLAIFSHSFAGGGLNLGKILDERRSDQLSSLEQGKKLGELLKPLMCSKCQINLTGCAACGFKMRQKKKKKKKKIAEGFAISLAKASGCHVVGYATGNSGNGYGWREDGGVRREWSTWANTDGTNLKHINPRGNVVDLPRTSSGKGRYPNVIE